MRKVKKNTISRLISNYRIREGIENNEHDTDGGRVKAFPTRTFIGSRNAFGEKFPWAIAPLKLLFGLVAIDAYIYRFKLSIAKIQLMTLDVNRTSYNSRKESEESKGMSKAALLNLQSVKKMEARLAKKWEQEFKHINLTDFFNTKSEQNDGK